MRPVSIYISLKLTFRSSIRFLCSFSIIISSGVCVLRIFRCSSSSGVGRRLSRRVSLWLTVSRLSWRSSSLIAGIMLRCSSSRRSGLCESLMARLSLRANLAACRPGMCVQMCAILDLNCCAHNASNSHLFRRRHNSLAIAYSFRCLSRCRRPTKNPRHQQRLLWASQVGFLCSRSLHEDCLAIAYYV